MKLFSVLFFMGAHLLNAQDDAFTGYAISKIKDGKSQIQTFGFMDRENAKPYTEFTIQPIGSVSKTVVGLAVMKAIELGFLDLDTDINRYLEFEVSNPNIETSDTITLRHLATHTSGIVDREKVYKKSYEKGLNAKTELGEFLKQYLTKDGKFYSKSNFGRYKAGQEYNYSNIGAALAAYIVEKAVKQSFSDFTEKYIFQQLGMHHTHWFYQENILANYSQLYDEKDKPLPFYSLVTYPDGALKTNISDLSLYLQALMDGFNRRSALLGNQFWDIYFKQNFSTEKPVKNINEKEPNIGIFIVYSKNGKIGHTGSDPGLSSILFFDPQTNEGKIFLGNEDITSKNLESFKRIWAGF